MRPPAEPQVIGFDLGKSFAWARVGHDSMLLESGASVPAKADGAVIGIALMRLVKEMSYLLEYYREQIALVVWESPRFERGRGGKYINEMMGVLRVICETREIPYMEVDPSTLKLFATGSGKASKAQMAEALDEKNPGSHLALELGEDAVDAAWVAVWGREVVLPTLYNGETP